MATSAVSEVASAHAVTRATGRSADHLGRQQTRCGCPAARRGPAPGPRSPGWPRGCPKSFGRCASRAAAAPRWPWSAAPAAVSRAGSPVSSCCGCDRWTRTPRASPSAAEPAVVAASIMPRAPRSEPLRPAGVGRRRAAEGRAQRLVGAPVAQPRRVGPEIACGTGGLDGPPDRDQGLLEAQQLVEVGRVVQHLTVGEVDQPQPGGQHVRASAAAPPRRTSSGTAP